MTQSAKDALRGAQWTLDDRVYGAARLKLGMAAEAITFVAGLEKPFYALVADKDEVTLIAPLDLLAQATEHHPAWQIGSTGFCLITLEVEFTLEVVGVMAYLTPALAEAGIPILALSAFSRDHFLVPEPRASEALGILRALTAD